MTDAQRKGMFREKTRSHNPMVEAISPSSAWTEDSKAHCLLVDLPGFKKEEVKLQIDDSRHITISGERLGEDNKFIVFERTYKIPKNADAYQISSKFDGKILYVTVPKKTIKKPEEPPNTKSGEAVEGENVESKNAHKDDKEKKNMINMDKRKKERAKKVDHNRKDRFPKKVVEKWWSQEASALLECATEKLKKHKGIVTIVAFAFSLGLLVGRKF